MAGQGAKKRHEENKKRLFNLRVLLLIGLTCQLIGIGLAYRGKNGVSSWSIAGLIITTLVGAACYMTISKIAAPVYGESGEMIDGGGDLNRGGINGYSHDILYITAFVQVTTLLSSWFWYFYLVVPAYALYKFYEMVIVPWWKSASADKGPEPQMDAMTRKKMQRTEDRAQRRRLKNFR